MASQDLHSNISATISIAAISVGAATTDGATVDTAGYESVEFVFSTGTVGASGNTFTPVIEESSTGAFGGEEVVCTVAAGKIIGNLTAVTNAAQVKRIGYAGKERYVRFTVTSTGSTNLISAVNILGAPHQAPVAE